MPTEEQIKQIKGYLFEVIVRVLMEEAGYRFEHSRPANFMRLRGRGSVHQIDAFGISDFPTPFVNSLRLLAEAKYTQVSIDNVRSFYGALKDVSQNYFVRARTDLGALVFGNRYTDMGVMFSSEDFTKPAIQFAFAHNILLISYADNPVMKSIVDSFESLCESIDFELMSETGTSSYSVLFYRVIKKTKESDIKHFGRFKRQRVDEETFRKQVKEFVQRCTMSGSLIGFVIGIYPVHLLSGEKGLKPRLLKAFRHTNEKEFALHYEALEQTIKFSMELPDERLEINFTLPKIVFEAYASRNRMLDAKEKYIKYIDVPVTEDFVWPSGQATKISRTLKMWFSRALTERFWREVQ